MQTPAPGVRGLAGSCGGGGGAVKSCSRHVSADGRHGPAPGVGHAFGHPASATDTTVPSVVRPSPKSIDCQSIVSTKCQAFALATHWLKFAVIEPAAWTSQEGPEVLSAGLSPHHGGGGQVSARGDAHRLPTTRSVRNCSRCTVGAGRQTPDRPTYGSGWTGRAGKVRRRKSLSSLYLVPGGPGLAPAWPRSFSGAC